MPPASGSAHPVKIPGKRPDGLATDGHRSTQIFDLSVLICVHLWLSCLAALFLSSIVLDSILPIFLQKSCQKTSGRFSVCREVCKTVAMYMNCHMSVGGAERGLSLLRMMCGLLFFMFAFFAWSMGETPKLAGFFRNSGVLNLGGLRKAQPRSNELRDFRQRCREINQANVNITKYHLFSANITKYHQIFTKSRMRIRIGEPRVAHSEGRDASPRRPISVNFRIGGSFPLAPPAGREPERGDPINFQPHCVLLNVIDAAISAPLSLTLSPQAGRGNKMNLRAIVIPRSTLMARRPYHLCGNAERGRVS